ncbi:MAG: OmpH family outer membrane protein [Thaumarchaeota archaeon]|nr:OmpH family outer membrane protein [Nitrososphaerota archaeon]
MTELVSLKQTVTHLFDAVWYSKHAQDLEEDAKNTDRQLEKDREELQSKIDEISRILLPMKDEAEEPLRDLARKLTDFASAAVDQAKSKLEKKAKTQIAEYVETASSERAKAVMSLEAYLASDPLPVLDNVVRVKLVEGSYVAQMSYECEGGVKYEFALALQNSKLFHEGLNVSQLGHEVKIPVRLGRTLLKKERVPGFERLDQYVLTDAEWSNGKILTTFRKPDGDTEFRIVYAGSGGQGFVGIEYRDKTQTVNVMNDPNLSAFVDIETIKLVMNELMSEIAELKNNKISLLKLTSGDEDLLQTLHCYDLLQSVFKIIGPDYRTLVKGLSASQESSTPTGELNLRFIQERLRILGDLSKPVSQLLGLTITI